MPAAVMSLAALSRATLARQLLLQRASTTALEAIDHLVGLQAQIPQNPYAALWSRLRGFEAADVESLLLERSLVRIVVMRGTIHLVTARDCCIMRPLVQPILDREMRTHSDFKHHVERIDFAEVTAFAAPHLAERPTSGRQLRALLGERFPQYHAGAMAYGCRNHLALVQIPPRGLWTRSGDVVSTTAPAWLGRGLETNPSIDDLVVRYLAAFGPATVADAAAWSGLTGLREVFERLGSRLLPMRGDDGRALSDLPDAPRPDADSPSPVRFLPEYDNVLLSYADRSRFMSENDRHVLAAAPRPVKGSVLAGGRGVGGWRVDRVGEPGTATIAIQTVTRLDDDTLAAIDAEAALLATFIHPALACRVTVAPLV